MTTTPSTLTYTVRNAVNDDNPASPVLKVTIDVGTVLPGGAKMPAVYVHEISKPTPDQIANLKAGAPVTLTLALATA